LFHCRDPVAFFESLTQGGEEGTAGAADKGLGQAIAQVIHKNGSLQVLRSFNDYRHYIIVFLRQLPDNLHNLQFNWQHQHTNCHHRHFNALLQELSLRKAALGDAALAQGQRL
jgi:hypothetical protein